MLDLYVFFLNQSDLKILNSISFFLAEEVQHKICRDHHWCDSWLQLYFFDWCSYFSLHIPSYANCPQAAPCKGCFSGGFSKSKRHSNCCWCWNGVLVIPTHFQAQLLMRPGFFRTACWRSGTAAPPPVPPPIRPRLVRATALSRWRAGGWRGERCWKTWSFEWGRGTKWKTCGVFWGFLWLLLPFRAFWCFLVCGCCYLCYCCLLLLRRWDLLYPFFFSALARSYECKVSMVQDGQKHEMAMGQNCRVPKNPMGKRKNQPLHLWSPFGFSSWPIDRSSQPSPVDRQALEASPSTFKTTQNTITIHWFFGASFPYNRPPVGASSGPWDPTIFSWRVKRRQQPTQTARHISQPKPNCLQKPTKTHDIAPNYQAIQMKSLAPLDTSYRFSSIKRTATRTLELTILHYSPGWAVRQRGLPRAGFWGPGKMSLDFFGEKSTGMV